MRRSPLRRGSWSSGIPSPGTTLQYVGLRREGRSWEEPRDPAPRPQSPPIPARFPAGFSGRGCSSSSKRRPALCPQAPRVFHPPTPSPLPEDQPVVGTLLLQAGFPPAPQLLEKLWSTKIALIPATGTRSGSAELSPGSSAPTPSFLPSAPSASSATAPAPQPLAPRRLLHDVVDGDVQQPPVQRPHLHRAADQRLQGTQRVPQLPRTAPGGKRKPGPAPASRLGSLPSPGGRWRCTRGCRWLF